MDFLRKIHVINKAVPFPTGTLLCTMDVSALYTNIPHAEGITACREALTKWREHITKPSATFLCNLIQHILTLNFFSNLKITFGYRHTERPWELVWPQLC
ncbi:hypothetical protein ElyMa_002284500 [Elysia marginata]|uniref:Reverse transcriptase domain-containing protein n=1 Tax=Elysia marginata TaxID=1093978 RepID=A0AAV4G3W1_9GAST|nr:hypothetical protein ElyMa_002284500 [Elysia marginata]